MGNVHWRQIPHQARPFFDDIGLKGPKEWYDDAEISPEGRRFVYEDYYSQILNQELFDF